MSRTPKVVVQQIIPHAGLGNCMFEIAGGLAVARRLGLPCTYHWTPSHKRPWGLRMFGLPPNMVPKRQPVLRQMRRRDAGMVDEACRRVQASGVELPAIQCPFQEEACFAEVAAEVRRRFRLDPIRPAVPPGKTPVAVHVRRGDYVGHPRLDVTTPDYFSNAMAYVTARLPSAHFVFVSEDPEWCRANFKGPNVTIAPPTDEAEALRTIVGCEAQIISNSTFGWWGAWLAGTDLVVAPDRWHRQEGAYGPWEPVPARWHRVGGTAASDDRAVEIHGEEPRHERAIVYPWNHRQAKWEELRYSLRSVERFFEDKNCPIYILGTERPGWLLFDEHRVRYINRWSYEEALNDGVQLAEKVLWMNDDILLLRPTTWDDCAVPYYLGTLDQGWVDTAAPKDNPWRKGVVRVMKQLREMGMTELRIYSTHMPYVYERVKAIEVLGEFGLWRKMPMELAYFHMHPEGERRLAGERVHTTPFGEAWCLNLVDKILTEDLKAAIEEMLPEPAVWELST